MNQQLPPELVQHLQETFLGKKIQVENSKGKWAGICQFIGPNPFFESWGLQVTLDRAFKESDLPDKVDRSFWMSLIPKISKEYYDKNK